jgi:triacylglycerol lipase
MTFELQIRARGPVLDMPFTQSLYKPLLDAQRRDGVLVERDLIYGADARQRLDVYRPEGTATGLLPMMVFLHGGGFIRGDKRDRENVGQYFARAGMVVVVPNYRLAPRHVWPAGALDAIAALQWAKLHAGHYGADGGRIFLAGESAGAAHVAAASLIRRFHPAEGLGVAGVILISGVYNVRLELLARAQFKVATPDPRNEAYFGSDFARYASMSTVALVDAQRVPMLITFAELDLLQMQVQAGELFARLVADHGFSPQLHVVRGHNHLTQVYAINTGDEALALPMLDFLLATRPERSRDALSPT